MKKLNPFQPLLLAILIISTSFFISARAKAQLVNQVNSDVNAEDYAEVKKPVDKPGTLFVEMNDGTIRNFTTLKMVTGILKTPHLVGDGQQIINGTDIKAYRDDEHFAVSQKTFESGRRTHLALEVLPGFVQRIATGKLNIYNKQYFNGYRKVDEFYIQSGSDGIILPYSESRLHDIVKDEPQAQKLFNGTNKKQTVLEKLQLCASIVNGSGMVTKN